MWPVYLLNMAKDTERLEKCRLALAAQNIPFQRFEAINGRALSPQEIAQVYDEEHNRKHFRHGLVASEIGVYLSYRALWQQVANSEFDGAIFLEDDFAASQDLAEVLQRLCSDNGDWDIAKLYTRRPGKKMLNRRRLGPAIELAEPFQVPNAMLGYAIRKDAARHLLDRKGRFFRPVDEDLRHFWEHGLKIVVTLPPPLNQGEMSKTGDTIEAARKSGRDSPLLVQGWRNFRYRVVYLAKLFYYRWARR